jgi:hypothetical protein
MCGPDARTPLNRCNRIWVNLSAQNQNSHTCMAGDRCSRESLETKREGN